MAETDRDLLELGEHIVDVHSASRALRPELFPLWHEGELLTAVPVALRSAACSQRYDGRQPLAPA